MVKLNRKSWTNYFWLLTFLYIVFCLIIYCVDVTIYGVLQAIDKEYRFDSITIAQLWQLTNESLKGFKFTLMIFGCGIAVWLIDMFITRRLLYMTTKAYKKEKAELENKKNEKPQNANISVKVKLPDSIDKPIKSFLDVFKKHIEIDDGTKKE